MNTQTTHATQAAFNRAIVAYETTPFYARINRLNSILIVALQAFLLINLRHIQFSLPLAVLIFFMSYIVTDFINGLVHMYMDNNTNYYAFFSPFIAVFHFHHHKLTYTDRPIWQVYFYESGYKFWLLPVLLASVIYSQSTHAYAPLVLLLTFFGILSSCAEVSHFLCHNRHNQAWVKGLQKVGLVLSMQHHKMHHKEDNTHYAFLNGSTDFIINKIAKRFYHGYHNHSDQHVKNYIAHTKTP